MMLLLVLCFRCLQVTNAFLQNSPPTVSTKLGYIRGNRLFFAINSVDEFLGVPYAKPPVGQLRFNRPQRPTPWAGVLDATRVSRYCSQPDFYVSYAEDCLYLNLWTPSRRVVISRYPVLIFIHGGGYLSGSGMEPIFNSSVLPQIRDVVVVTINYRLGVFGFFNGDRDDAPGNVGLWDQAMALNWVRDNVAFFGGDPDQITISGQSAGSASVGMLSLSPYTRNLFKRALMMSGSPFSVPTKEANVQRSKRLAGFMKCNVSENWVQCLRQVNEYDLIYNSAILNYFIFGPNYGDAFYPELAAEALRNGHFNPNLNLFSGLEEDEGDYVLMVLCNKIPGFERNKPKEINRDTAKRCVKTCVWHQVQDEAASYYLDNVPDNDSQKLRRAVSKAVGDFYFTCPTFFYSELFAKWRTSQNVYSYHIDYRSRSSYFCNDSDWAGICHADELYFLFGAPFKEPGLYNDTDRRFSSSVIDIWTTYGRTGQPPGQGGTYWPSYQSAPMTLPSPPQAVQPMNGRPLWPNYMKLNPLKTAKVYYRPYYDCDNFWRKHFDIWLSTDSRLRNEHNNDKVRFYLHGVKY